MRDVRIRDQETHGLTRIWRARIQTALEPGEAGSPGTAAAFRVRYNGSNWVDTTESLDVYDPTGKVWAFAQDLVWVKRCHDSNFWEVISGSTSFPWCKVWFAVTAGFTTSDSIFSAEITRVIGAPFFAEEDPVAIVNQPAANSPYLYSGSTGDCGQAYYDALEEELICDVLECTPPE